MLNSSEETHLFWNAPLLGDTWYRVSLMPMNNHANLLIIPLLSSVKLYKDFQLCVHTRLCQCDCVEKKMFENPGGTIQQVEKIYCDMAAFYDFSHCLCLFTVV